jgi:hypothetical protein
VPPRRRTETTKPPAEDRQVGFPGRLDDDDALLGLGLENEITEGRDGEEREDERGEEGDDVGEGQRQEHFALDPLQGDDRDEGEGDDKFAEDGRLAHFENRLEDDRQFAQTPAGFGQMTLDVFDLDDCRVDDHPDRDGQSAERHQVRR